MRVIYDRKKTNDERYSHFILRGYLRGYLVFKFSEEESAMSIKGRLNSIGKNNTGYFVKVGAEKFYTHDLSQVLFDSN